MTEIKHLVLGLYFALAALSISILGFKLLKNRRNLVHIAYDDDFSAKGRRGLSILEISRLNEIPHAHVCSGRGSCGTCRVRVETGIQHLSELGERERRTLAMVQAGENVRLACQALVNGSPISVTRLLPAFADAAAARAPGEWLLMPEDEVGSSHASPAVTSETTA